MLPPFTKEGYLPPGIYEIDLDELQERFAYTIWRKELFKNLVRLINDLKSINCKAIYVDGSFVTNKRIPGDMDICWDNTNLDYDEVEAIMPILFDFTDMRRNQQLIYKADIFPAFEFEGSSGVYFIDFFQKDKATNNPKGIIKIIIH
jgi:hypothetical protein